jgi:dodecin
VGFHFKKGYAMSVYKVIEVIGSSAESWEDAAKKAVERATKTLDDVRIAEVIEQDLKVENGKISAFRTKLQLSFKFKD